MTIETKSPTTNSVIVAGWNNPANAYAEDAIFADSDTTYSEQQYGGYGFNIPANATINQVQGGIKGYKVSPDYLRLKIGSGAEIEVLASVYQPTVNTLTYFTSTVIAWTPAKVNSIFSRAVSILGGGGCVSLDTLILMFDRTVKKVQDLKPNDILLGMNDETRQWIPSVVKNIHVWKGDFHMVRILYQKPNGVVVTTLVSKEHFLWVESKKERVKIKDLAIGDMLHDYFQDRLVEVPIVKMKSFQTDTMYDIKLKRGHHYFFGDNLLGLIKDCVNCTSYLDWMPIRVTYTVPSGKQIRVIGDAISESIG